MTPSEPDLTLLGEEQMNSSASRGGSTIEPRGALPTNDLHAAVADAIHCGDIAVTYDSVGRQYTHVTNADEVASAILRIVSRRAQEGWQDISTAPRDGTPILIFQPDAGLGFGCRTSHMPPAALGPNEHSYSHDDPRLQYYDDARWAIGYWRPWGGWGNRNSATVKPTHWMPLPASPSLSPLPEE